MKLKRRKKGNREKKKDWREKENWKRMKRMKRMVKGHTLSPMEQSMKENGRMGKNMVKGH